MAHGLARAREERVGRRPRTVYSITPKGRRALARWLREPGAGPVLEFQALLKVIFAENGRREDALASLQAVRRWAAWATTQVEAWPDDVRQARPDTEALAEIARRARW